MLRPWHTSWPDDIPHTIELPSNNIVDSLAQNIPSQSDTAYIHFLEHTWTFGEVYSEVQALAAFLVEKGVKSSDIIAILLPNTPQFVIAFYASQYLGCITTPINLLFVTQELKHQLQDSEASVLITGDWLYDNIIPIKDQTRLKLIITTSIGDVLSPLKAFIGKIIKKIPTPKLRDPDAVSWKEVMIHGRSLPPPQKSSKDPDDVALLMYTGGTTGPSKGAMLTHRNLNFIASALGYWTPTPMEPGKDAFVAALPFFHTYGLSVALITATFHGGRVILIPNPRDIEAVMSQTSKYKGTYFPGVPTLYIAILSHPKLKKFDLKSIKFCLSGAAPLPVQLQKDFEKETGAVLLEGYGLTETSPVTHANPISSVRKEGSVGIPILNTDAKIVDIETKKELQVGEIGEICMRGPQIMKGYWKRPDETEKVIDKDGWFYSGDIGKMDEDGFFYITDRLKDMIIVGGYKVFPRDVEEVLFRHPDIQNCAVVGIPDPRTTERVRAYVVLKEGKNTTAEELLEYCSKNLAKYRVPREIEIRSNLPLTAVGKVLRRELRQEAIASEKGG